MKKIIDDNFTTIICGGRIITIANATGDYGVLSVGERTATGHLLTQADYDRLLSDAE